MYRNMWNDRMESIAPSAQRTLERTNLARQLEYVYANSPLYKRRFGEAGVKPGDIRDADDLSRLPLTTKADLRESQEREPPFGDYLAAPRESVIRVHRTSGSTGRFLYTALTKDDIEQTNECGARAFWAGGLRPHHSVVHCLNYSLWMGGYTDHSNLETTGATVLPFGVGSSRQLIRLIHEARVDVLSSTPSYPGVLEEVVREELGIEPAELGLKLGLFGGEPALENPDFKGRLEQTWGMRASNANYGLSEVMCNFAATCDRSDELHFMGQGSLLAELIDPSSSEEMPLEEGKTGELVLTNLAKEAQPLVRYRTNDLVTVLGVGPCGCARTGFRFRIIGRTDDMVHVKGVNVFPSGIANVLQGLAPSVTGEFQVVLTHLGPYDRLDIRVEHGAEVGPDEMQALKLKIERQIREHLSASAEVELVAPNSIARTDTGKATRVLKEF